MALSEVLEELVTANRILAREGHRRLVRPCEHPPSEVSNRYLISRARAPECIGSTT
jgi:hypothetical protein